MLLVSFLEGWLFPDNLLISGANVRLCRLYCAMHSFTDCAMGILLGSAISAVQWSCGEMFENWMMTPGWAGTHFYYEVITKHFLMRIHSVPFLVIPLGLFLVNQHAEPVDDCPCFEDAIAFVSVIIGSVLARWHAFNWGLDEHANFFQSKTPGWEGRDIGDWSVWLAFGALKMIVGMYA